MMAPRRPLLRAATLLSHVQSSGTGITALSPPARLLPAAVNQIGVPYRECQSVGHYATTGELPVECCTACLNLRLCIITKLRISSCGDGRNAGAWLLGGGNDCGENGTGTCATPIIPDNCPTGRDEYSCSCYNCRSSSTRRILPRNTDRKTRSIWWCRASRNACALLQMQMIIGSSIFLRQ